jgi:hypothetical protein
MEGKSSEWLNAEQARIVLGGVRDKQMRDLCQQIKVAYTDRSPYQRILSFEVGPEGTKKIKVSLPVDQILFFKKNEEVKVGFAPEAFIPLYQIVNQTDRETAENWWWNHSILSKLKSSEWLDQIEFAREIGVDSTNEKYEKLWRECQRRSKSGDLQMGSHMIYGEDKRIAFDNTHKKTFCMHQSEQEWAKWKLGMESAYDQEQDKAEARSLGFRGI